MKYESNNFQFEAEMPWESAGEGVVRQIMGYNDNLMMVKEELYHYSGRRMEYCWECYGRRLECRSWCTACLSR